MAFVRPIKPWDSLGIQPQERELYEFAARWAHDHRNGDYWHVLMQFGRDLLNSPVSFNGRTAPFEGADRGSSPRAGAK